MGQNTFIVLFTAIHQLETILTVTNAMVLIAGKIPEKGEGYSPGEGNSINIRFF